MLWREADGPPRSAHAPGGGEQHRQNLLPRPVQVAEGHRAGAVRPGQTFLALLRALNDLAHNDIPNFKQPPYDLGSFDEIAHYRGGRGGRAEAFRAADGAAGPTACPGDGPGQPMPALNRCRRPRPERSQTRTPQL